MISTFLFKKQGGKYVTLNVIEGKNFKVNKGIPFSEDVNHRNYKQVNIIVNPEAKCGFEVRNDRVGFYYQDKYEGKFEKIARELAKVKYE